MTAAVPGTDRREPSLPRRLLNLAAPLFIAQIAVTANGVIDTIMAGRVSAVDVAAVGLGASIYVSVHVALMGILLALVPICARHFGAGRHGEIAAEIRQGIWLALLIAVPGCLALGASDAWLRLAAPPEAVAEIVRPYLLAVALGLPAALLFRVFHALAVSTGQPRLVMALNLAALSLKVPANALFMHGLSWQGTPLVPALGGAGCAVATALITWLTLLAAVVLTARHSSLRSYCIFKMQSPEGGRLLELLKLGLPIGLTQLVEVTAFTFMAIFLAHTGAVIAASHQIAATSAAFSYMVALSIGLATSTLAAHAIGAQDEHRARQTAIGGLRIALLASSLVSIALFVLREPLSEVFSTEPMVRQQASRLLAWVALFHFLDSLQTQLTMILRAWQVTARPALIHGIALWGIGLGAGWWLGIELAGPGGPLDGRLGQATAFWLTGCASLALASVGLARLLQTTWRVGPVPGKYGSIGRTR